MQNLATESLPADVQNLVHSYPSKPFETGLNALCDLQETAI